MSEVFDTVPALSQPLKADHRGHKEGGVRRTDVQVAAREARADGFSPAGDFKGLSAPWLCRCARCRRLVEIKLSNLRKGYGDCPLCVADARIQVMRNAAAEPRVDYPGAREPWLCECLRCGEPVTPTYDNVRRGQGACRYCVGQGPVPPERAEREMIELGIEPLDPYPGDVHAPWRCRCMECDKEITPSRANALRQHPCRYCSKKKAGLKTRVCTAEEANQILEGAGLEATKGYPGKVLGPWSVRCKTCTWRGSVALNYLRQGHRPVCLCYPGGLSGFDGSRPALLYVLRHDGHGAGKIGITNEGAPRLRQLRFTGWTVVEAISFAEGWRARIVEQAVLNRLRLEGCTSFVPRSSMRYGGHTETFDLRRHPVAVVLALISAEMAAPDSSRARESKALPPVAGHQSY
jgi:hypothetical protein